MEVWKYIEEYEGLYSVSSFGRVMSEARYVVNKNGNKQYYPQKLLKPDVYKTKHSNYLRVTLCKEHKTQRYSVHRLVANAFIPKPIDKDCVNHLDNNAENNCVDNLEWCTHSENMQHSQRQGRLFLSQSNGGKIGGAVGTNKRMKSIETIQGTQIGSWTVLDTPSKQKAQKAYVSCKCVCGTTQYVEFTRLIREESLNCRKCGQHKRKRS